MTRQCAPCNQLGGRGNYEMSPPQGPAEQVVCPLCGYAFQRRHMADHWRTRHPAKCGTALGREFGIEPKPRVVQKPVPITGRVLSAEEMERRVKCPHCRFLSLPEDLERHVSALHGDISLHSPAADQPLVVVKDRLVRCSKCQKSVSAERLDVHDAVSHPNPGRPARRLRPHSDATGALQPSLPPTGRQARLVVGQRQPRRVCGLLRLCAECGLPGDTLLRFTHSTQGIAYVCDRCVQKVLERSFGKSDLLDHSKHGGLMGL